MDIEQVKSECSPEEKRQVKVAIAKSVSSRQIELRQTVTYNSPVVFIGKNEFNDFALLIINHPFTFFVDTGITQHIKVANRLSHLYALKRIAGIRSFRPTFIVIVLPHIL